MAWKGIECSHSDEHWVIYGTVESCCTHETNKTLYVNYTLEMYSRVDLIKIVVKKKNYVLLTKPSISTNVKQN